MRASATTAAALESGADTVVVLAFEGEPIAHDLPGGDLSALLERGEAKAKPGHLALARAGDTRVLLAGAGERDAFTAERARVAAAKAVGRAKELGTATLCFELPHAVDDDVAGALVEGATLAAYRFSRRGADEEDAEGGLEEVVVSAHHDVSGAVMRAAVVSEAVNAMRDLQNMPGNEATPTRLADRAHELADAHEQLTVEVEGRDGIVARGMGAFAAVAAGTYEEPQLIVLRHEPPQPAEGAPVLGLVGKAVTFDTGGISLKPGAKMSEMKFDMSGGAAVIEAVGAIAALGLPVRVVAVVGATENMPSGRSVKPGDVVRSAEGLTVEVNNTDAEGRLVLADCLFRARELGAERLVDLATLTGAVLVGLGKTHAGLMSDDDAWAAEVEAAATTTGELVWRLPLHEEYAELVKGKVADLDNAPEGRLAGTITAAQFLQRFTGDVPWVHLDIAGTAWDLGRAYAAKGGSGFGVRALVALAEAQGATKTVE